MTDEGEVAELKQVTQGKSRARPKQKGRQEGPQEGAGKKRPRRGGVRAIAAEGAEEQQGEEHDGPSAKEMSRPPARQRGKQAAVPAGAGKKRARRRHIEALSEEDGAEDDAKEQDVEMKETEEAAAPTATARPPGGKRGPSRRRAVHRNRGRGRVEKQEG